MEKTEAPTLFKALYKIRPKSFDYCCVCLRTGTERRLVEPRIYKKFVEAINLDREFKEGYQVCYMCERQASIAYKFYKAATFATTVKNLLREYLDKRKIGMSESYEQKRFQQMFSKKRLECRNPVNQWDTQLRKIRTRTELLHTEVLVIDSQGTHCSNPGKSKCPTDSGEVYIVPDEPDELLEKLTDTSDQTSAIDTVILIDEDEEKEPANESNVNSLLKSTPNLNTGPKLVPIQKLLDRPRIKSTEIIFEGNADQSYNQPLATLTGPTTLAPLANIPTTQLQLATSVNGLPTTNGTIAPSTGMPEKYILHPIILDLHGNLTVPSLASNLINNVIQMPHVVDNNLLQLNTTGNDVHLNNVFQISQGISNSNVLQVNDADTSLRFNIMPNNSFNVQIPQQNIINNSNQMFRLDVAKNTNKTDLNVVPDVTHKTNVQSDHIKQINDLANEIISEVELSTVNRDDIAEINKSGSTPAVNNFGIKRSIKLNAIGKDVPSVDKKKKKDDAEREKEPVKRTDRIDWEDKIPMDVISFVDAIDPNVNKLLYNKPQEPQYEISHVRSLKMDHTSKPRRPKNYVIDLC